VFTPTITAQPRPAHVGELLTVAVTGLPDDVTEAYLQGGKLAGGADHLYRLEPAQAGPEGWTGAAPLARCASDGKARLRIGARRRTGGELQWYEFEHPIAGAGSWPPPRHCSTRTAEVPGHPELEMILHVEVRERADVAQAAGAR
jgi:hypothetical protein